MNRAGSPQDEQHCKVVYANFVCFDVAMVFVVVVVVCLFLFSFDLCFNLSMKYTRLGPQLRKGALRPHYRYYYDYYDYYY